MGIFFPVGVTFLFKYVVFFLPSPFAPFVHVNPVMLGQASIYWEGGGIDTRPFGQWGQASSWGVPAVLMKNRIYDVWSRKYVQIYAECSMGFSLRKRACLVKKEATGSLNPRSVFGVLWCQPHTQGTGCEDLRAHRMQWAHVRGPDTRQLGGAAGSGLQKANGGDRSCEHSVFPLSFFCVISLFEPPGIEFEPMPDIFPW